ncbi:reverse transcriptase domain-containing protein [Tanacetum coccineum]
MRTRSSSNLIVESSTIPKRRNRRRSKQIVKPELRTIVETPVATMADTRTMSELLQAPTEGYGDAIVIPAILAENFELKVGLLQLVTSSQFHGFERDDPHAHIRWFNKITSTLKYKNVPHDAIKLMLFPFSLEGAARIWLEKEPPRSILTWEDLVSKFVNYFFPPSKTTNLKNDITNFQQKFDETFSEAWDQFKDLLHKCPHHGFSELHQIDTFYNAFTQSDQDSLNAATGVSTTNSSSSPSPDVTALTEIIKELVLMNKANQQASVKAVEETFVTYGGPHPYYECLATDGNTFNASAATGTYNQGCNRYHPQGDPNYRTSNQMGPPAQVGPSNELKNYMKSNEATLRAMQTQMTKMKTELQNEFKSSLDTRTNMIENQNNQIMNMLTNLTMQKQSPSGSGSLPSNTVANPRGDVKAITTLSGVVYDGPTIRPTFSPLPKEVEHKTEVTKDKVQTTSSESTAHVQPPVVQIPIQEPKVAPKLHFDISFADALFYMSKFASTFKSLLSNKEKLFELASTPLNENCLAVLLKKLPEKLGDPDRFLIPLDFDVDPRVPLILGRPFFRTARALIDVHGEELILRDGDEQLIFHTNTTSKYPNEHRIESIKMINFIDISCEDNFEEVLKIKKLSHHLSGSTTSTPDSSPSLTPIETSDYLLEEFADELALLDPFPPGFGDADFDPEGDILLLEKLLNDDSSSPLPPKELNFDNVNHLFNEVLKDIESEDSYVSNHDESALLVTPLFDANEDECFDPRGDIDEIDAFLNIDVFTDIEDGYHNLEGDIIYLENLLNNDIIPYLPLEVFLDHDLRSLKDELDNNDLKSMVKVFNPDISAYSFYSLELVAYEKICSSTCFVPNIIMIWGEIAPDFEDSRACGFVHRSLDL